MNLQIRVRRHTDGRVAISVTPFSWAVVTTDRPNYGATDEHVASEGWSELFVADLPEPDGEYVADLPEPDGEYAGDHGPIPFWETKTGAFDLEEGDIEDISWLRDIDEIRSDALKMLAAVAACEKYRTERETTT